MLGPGGGQEGQVPRGYRRYKKKVASTAANKAVSFYAANNANEQGMHQRLNQNQGRKLNDLELHRVNRPELTMLRGRKKQIWQN